MRNNFMHETRKKDQEVENLLTALHPVQESDVTRKKDVDVAAVELLDLGADNVKCD